jgi:beta-phosphoglucomutase-like phosphatase (HAD superfamily)
MAMIGTKKQHAKTSALRAFLSSEAAGGILLMAAAALAMIIANSPIAENYTHFLHLVIGPELTPKLGPMTVHLWINDGLMAIFFLLVGLEIKREFVDGHLSTWADRTLPMVAAAAGYSPDNLVCAGDLAQGRPSPLMMYRCFADLGVFPPHAVVKVDDTEPGIAEGLAAGCWTVGVAVSGNAFGLSRDEVEALSAEDFADRRVRAHASLKASGAHVVIDSVADLLPVVMDFDRQLADGRTPG